MRDDLVDRAAALAAGPGRCLLGIVGAPGAGKSTMVAELIGALADRGIVAGWLPMDGFHLADAQLDRLGRKTRKGAIDTFDEHGFLAMLHRVREETGHDVYVPGFERDLEQPIAAALAIEPSHRLVVTEGNYLLDRRGAWPQVRELLAETWFVDTADEERRRRIVARHVRYGKSAAAAAAYVRDVDEVNARDVVLCRDRADLVIPGLP